MATQVQLYNNCMYATGQTLSDVSTEGEDDVMGFYKLKCFDRTLSKIRDPQNNKAKSSLCKNFTQTGICRYGDKCQFAHGTHELRCNAQINISYKTKYCNSFLNKKCCIYGFRCNFIHKNNLQINEQQKWTKIYENHRETIRECRVSGKGSRLMTMLGHKIN